MPKDIITKPKSKAAIKRDQKAALIQRGIAPTIEQQTTNLDAGKPVGRGRPTDYTDDLAAEFCSRIADGRSMRTVCRADDMPERTTIFRWIAKYPIFCDQYTRACADRAEAFAEDIIDIADDGTNDYMEIKDADGNGTGAYRLNGEAIQRSKLRMEARQWYNGKVKPKKYGNQIDITSGGQAIPAPLIYVPQELPYNAITKQRVIINGETTTEPAATGQSEASEPGRLYSPTGENVVPGTTNPQNTP